jgi:hypothetical protein
MDGLNRVVACWRMQRNTWADSIDAVQNFMAFFLLMAGIVAGVLGIYVATLPAEKEVEMFGGSSALPILLGCAGTAALLIILAIFELSPHLCGVCCNRYEMEKKVGKILFFFYAALTVAGVGFGIFCFLGHLGEMSVQLGWVLMLLSEFMGLHALCNVCDWKGSRFQRQERETTDAADFGLVDRSSVDANLSDANRAGV